MCGIAGIIYRNGNGGRPLGVDMTRMLQSMKHRGPDSTGYALFGPHSHAYIMRFKLADANDPRDFEFADRIRRNRHQAQQRVPVHQSAARKMRGVSFEQANAVRRHDDVTRLVETTTACPPEHL